jgi:hypothetical protein
MPVQAEEIRWTALGTVTSVTGTGFSETGVTADDEVCVEMSYDSGATAEGITELFGVFAEARFLGEIDLRIAVRIRGQTWSGALPAASSPTNAIVTSCWDNASGTPDELAVRLRTTDGATFPSFPHTGTATDRQLAIDILDNTAPAELFQRLILPGTTVDTSQATMAGGSIESGTDAINFEIELATLRVGGPPIAWGVATALSGDPDVSTNGTLAYAYNIGGSSTTVNGVDFTGTSTSQNIGGDITTDPGSGPYPSAFGSDSDPYASLSSDYKELLVSGVENWSAIDLNNLTAGVTYEVQIWANDSREDMWNRSQSVDEGAVITDFNQGTDPVTGAGALGDYVIGTFTASGSTQSFTLSGTPTLLNAIQVREVSPVTAIEITGVSLDSGTVTLDFAAEAATSYSLTGGSDLAGFPDSVTPTGGSLTTDGSGNGSVSFAAPPAPYFVRLEAP